MAKGIPLKQSARAVLEGFDTIDLDPSQDLKELAKASPESEHLWVAGWEEVRHAIVAATKATTGKSRSRRMPDRRKP
jgi:hypothetical protein